MRCRKRRGTPTADAERVWRQIHILYDTTDGAIAADLLDEFHLKKCPVDWNAVRHLIEMGNLNRQLAIAGEAVTDRTHALRMVKSLPEEQYGQIKSNLLQSDSQTSAMVGNAVRKGWRRIGSPTNVNKPKDRAKSDKPVKQCDNHPNATGHSTDNTT
ncbi:hypothetical protein NCC49_001982 [Naganishia albida]|nr:hypothetical protein NCC49_001982 [Naganishia albida]